MTAASVAALSDALLLCTDALSMERHGRSADYQRMAAATKLQREVGGRILGLERRHTGNGGARREFQRSVDAADEELSVGNEAWVVTRAHTNAAQELMHAEVGLGVERAAPTVTDSSKFL